MLHSCLQATGTEVCKLENEKKKSFGEFITQRRRALGMTQREFADKLFVTDSAVSKWERGMSYPDITLIRDICEILGVSEHELLTASEDVEARSAEKLAARYRRMARNYRLAHYIIYGGAALSCLVFDMADGGGLDWSLIVFASLLALASLTLLPALAPERMGGVWALGGFTCSLLALYGVICLVDGARWFVSAACWTLLAAGLLFAPYILRRLPMPKCLGVRKGVIYICVNTLLLLLLLGEECIRTGGTWFFAAALGSLLGIWLLFGPYILRHLPLPDALKNRKTLLYAAVSTALLLALLAEEGIRGGGTWFLPTALGILLGLAVLVLPFVMKQLPLPKELNNHRALVWLAIVTVLLAALLPAAGRLDYLWSESYPLMLVGMLWPWLMLACLRYLPVPRLFRASAACGVTALYIWLAPWAVDGIITANGWVSSVPYNPLRPYGVDFSDWVSAPALGGNIMVTIMLALVLAAVILAVVGARRRK